MLRAVQAAGGFATVIAKGEPEAGTILLVMLENGRNGRLFERMPRADGDRVWECTSVQKDKSDQEFNELLSKRRARDPDLWIVELDIPQAERFVVGSIARG